MPKVKAKEEPKQITTDTNQWYSYQAQVLSAGPLSSPTRGEVGELHDRINNLEFLNKVITSDSQRSNLLLREVLSQLYKDKDEYHADLHDKIVKELGE